MLSARQITSFRKEIFDHYKKAGRILPWRETVDPYHILVSEIMLQQTQVERVLIKYPVFIGMFSDFRTLAQAELKDVLRLWQGLGYNRRALMLKQLAEIVIEQYNGSLPDDKRELENLPGIGKATTGAILAFAFNMPSVFIETNIRRVFIHYFFKADVGVTDREILLLVEQTLDRENPRTWYYALMDYGAMLKKQVLNPNRRSAHYQKQSPFRDSDRKIRGEILRLILRKSHISEGEVHVLAADDVSRAKRILHQLEREGLIKEQNGTYCIS